MNNTYDSLVQQTFNLPYNSLVKITVAKYFTTSGRCIQALDYAHKDDNGKAEKFADSLSKPFTTKNNRTVFDGNGVYPDIYIPNEKLSEAAVALLNKGSFFDFANQYKKNHKEIAGAKAFQITNPDYTNFISSLGETAYDYTSTAETLLTNLNSATAKDGSINGLKADLELLKAKLLASKKSNLTSHQVEIKKLLETQIVSRYYFEKGKIEQSFQYDSEVLKADYLFKNQAIMLSILNGEGEYKIISQVKP